ncbi:MAG: TerB N-terminal domain-containing protein [Alphaproteobacteria bacterium]|nr:TerB N-terminal domain-containing protein [Alphaproteobacteria bacterium]
MAKKKNSTASGILFLGALVVWAISSIPPEVWRVIGSVSVPAILLWLLFRRKTPSIPDKNKDELLHYEVAGHASGDIKRETSYRIPSSPSIGKDNARWVAAGETIRIQNIKIEGGFFYLGSRLSSQTGGTEPSLIDPALHISSGQIDISERLMGYWPSYSHISPEARACYMHWMSDGRKAPHADIGYIFLFFYGLERRALVDANVNDDAKRDIPQIITEVRRLLSIYSTNHSFKRYAENFLQALELQTVQDRLYEKAAPTLSADFRELPFYMRIGLGQLAAEGKSIPVRWAFFWAFVLADYGQRKRILRCPEIAEKLFSKKYEACFEDGLKLAANKTKLKLEYASASSGIARGRPIPVSNDLPDVSATTVAVKKLLPILASCAEELNAYSRYIARNVGQENSLEALLQLPVSLWPNNVRTEIEKLKSQIGDSQLLISFAELSGLLGNAESLNRSKIIGLANALQNLQIGMEPDVLAGARTPQTEDIISLFIAPGEDITLRLSAPYKTAAVILGLACAVAHADGTVSQEEMVYLSGLIESWQHLTLSQRYRLKAYMRLQMKCPDRLASLKKKLEPLTAEAKQSVAQHAVHLAQTDGVVTPTEVRILEKIYQAIGVDTQQLYKDIHSVGPASLAKISSTKLREAKTILVDGDIALDADRIAALKSETEQVSALLAGVFSDDLPPEQFDTTSPDNDDVETTNNNLIQGLDAEHRAFLQVLGSRSIWARTELLEVAADMKLLLDGALERINEAFFDQYDEPFCEGEDPVEINAQLMERIAA